MLVPELTVACPTSKPRAGITAASMDQAPWCPPTSPAGVADLLGEGGKAGTLSEASSAGVPTHLAVSPCSGALHLAQAVWLICLGAPHQRTIKVDCANTGSRHFELNLTGFHFQQQLALCSFSYSSSWPRSTYIPLLSRTSHFGDPLPALALY